MYSIIFFMKLNEYICKKTMFIFKYTYIYIYFHYNTGKTMWFLRICRNKPRFIGTAVLGLGKEIMYDFHYKYMVKI